MAYVTREELKTWIGIDANITDQDPRIDACLEAAEAAVDDYCGRNFVVVDPEATPTARTFEAEDEDEIEVDDIGAEPTDLALETSVDRITWTSLDTDHAFPGPLRVLSKRVPEPYTCIELVGPGSGYFQEYVRVTTAKWGWPAIPAQVLTAVKLTAHWLYRRPADPYGITFADMPTRLSSAGDSDVRRLLAPYRRMDRVSGIA